MANNLASSLLRTGATDFRRYAEFLFCILANGTDGRQSRFVPSTEKRRRLSQLRGVPVLRRMAGNLASSPMRRSAADFRCYAEFLSCSRAYGQQALMASNLVPSPRRRGPADFRRCAEFLSCIWAMALMVSNLASSPLRRGAADFRRYAESLSCICANGINGRQSGSAPPTEKRRRLSPLRGVPVLHMGKWHQW